MYGSELTIEDLWRWTNLLERVVLVVLAIMLVRVFIVVARVSYRYRLAQHSDAVDQSSGTFERARRLLVADLLIQVGSLKSIAFVAPYLGLSGTCIGIVDNTFRGYIGSRGGFIAMVAYGIAAAFLSTAAGILVATPAAAAHNHLRVRIESLRSEVFGREPGRRDGCWQVAQRLPLGKRFSQLPAFAIIAASAFAVSITAFMTFSSFNPPMGFPVILAKTISNMDFVSLQPIKIVITIRNKNGLPIAYVNSKETLWDQLGTVVQHELKVGRQALVFVQAESDASWRDVVDAVDIVEGLQVRVVLLTDKPQDAVRRRVQ